MTFWIYHPGNFKRKDLLRKKELLRKKLFCLKADGKLTVGNDLV